MLSVIPPRLHRLALRLVHPLRSRLYALTKPHLRGVSVIGVDGQGRLLLVRLSYGDTREWHLPGGGIRRSETPEAAARRELAEEAGCEADGLSLVASFEEAVLSTQSTAYLFAGTILTAPRADGRETLEARFFPTHSLPVPMSARTRRRLEMWWAANRAGR